MRILAIFFVLLAVPVLVAWIKAYPRIRFPVYFGIGFLPFAIDAWNLDAALIDWATWPGYVKGAVLTLLDSLSLAVLVSHPRLSRLPKLSIYLVIYISCTLLSAAFSAVPIASLFYPFQLLRILALFAAVAKIVDEPKALNWLAMGLAAGVSLQAGYTIWQKTHGTFQPAGTMGHQNLLGMMTHFVTFPLLGLLLAGMRNRLAMVGVISALIVVALGASRGAIGFTLAGTVLLITLSLIRRPTKKKWKIIGLSVLVMALISPLMFEAIGSRLKILEHETYDERGAFERAARSMFADHPMGVGANQYVVVANAEGYSARAGVTWASGSRGANVHNAYLLVGAETGWLGLLSFLALWLGPIFSGLRFAFQDRRDPRGELILGCTVALIIVAAHNLYEWIFVTYQAQYVFAICLGIISGLSGARSLPPRKHA